MADGVCRPVKEQLCFSKEATAADRQYACFFNQFALIFSFYLVNAHIPHGAQKSRFIQLGKPGRIICQELSPLFRIVLETVAQIEKDISILGQHLVKRGQGHKIRQRQRRKGVGV